MKTYLSLITLLSVYQTHNYVKCESLRKFASIRGGVSFPSAYRISGTAREESHSSEIDSSGVDESDEETKADHSTDSENMEDLIKDIRDGLSKLSEKEKKMLKEILKEMGQENKSPEGNDKREDEFSKDESERYATILKVSDISLQDLNRERNPPQPELTAKMVQNHLLMVLLVQIPQVVATHLFGAVGTMIGMAWARKLISVANVQKSKKPKEKICTFEDVVGCDEVKDEVKQIVDFLTNPEKYSKLGAKVPRGLLLVGPPGTGKTLLAKACAGEAGVQFLYSCGSDYNTMFAGQGVELVKQQFNKARKLKKAIIFIDELDYVGKKRSSNAFSQQSVTLDRESTLTQLLAEMDGFSPNDGIVVVATTNRADMLDPALMRSGRFGMAIEVEAPDKLGREQLFQKYLSKMTIKSKVLGQENDSIEKENTGNVAPPNQSNQTISKPKKSNMIDIFKSFGLNVLMIASFPYGPVLFHLLNQKLEKKSSKLKEPNFKEGKCELEIIKSREMMAKELAGLTPGLVGADIEEICNIAAIAAARKGADGIDIDDLSNAIDRVRGGIEKKNKKVLPEERIRTAIHEAGHAVVGWMLPYADPINKVSIVWRGSALGFTQSLPSERTGNKKEHFLDYICMCLAGRAAEDVFLGEVSDGASQDLKQASEIIRDMITRFGFGKSIGLFAPSDWSLVSESTSRKIDEETQEILEEQYARAKDLIRIHQHHIIALKSLLLDIEVVREEGLISLLGAKVTEVAKPTAFSEGISA